MARARQSMGRNSVTIEHCREEIEPTTWVGKEEGRYVPIAQKHMMFSFPFQPGEVVFKQNHSWYGQMRRWENTFCHKHLTSHPSPPPSPPKFSFFLWNSTTLIISTSTNPKRFRAYDASPLSSPAYEEPSSGLRRRGGGDGKNAETSTFGEPIVSKPPPNPLLLFGGLLAPELRQAQKEFQEGKFFFLLFSKVGIHGVLDLSFRAGLYLIFMVAIMLW